MLLCWLLFVVEIASTFDETRQFENVNQDSKQRRLQKHCCGHIVKSDDIKPTNYPKVIYYTVIVLIVFSATTFTMFYNILGRYENKNLNHVRYTFDCLTLKQHYYDNYCGIISITYIRK